MSEVASRVATLLGRSVADVSRLSGGDLSAVWRVTLDDGRAVIAKQGDAVATEAEMLRAIGGTGIPSPAVMTNEGDWLVMQACASGGSLRGDVWLDLAQVLAQLHAETGEGYGWPKDYAFGDVAIENATCARWTDFWADRRLRCHLPHIASDLADRIDRLAGRIGDHLPTDPLPALLHGDLWGGNVLVAGERISALIDPACYHGDREVDIAMLTLFDHPPRSFFDACALAPGWRERQPVYRLWPLLVHLRLFGDAYRGSVTAALDMLGV